MAYKQPYPVAMALMRIADMQLAAGNKVAAAQTLYGNGYTWADLTAWQVANNHIQKAPPEMSLPPELRGMGILGLRHMPVRRSPPMLAKVARLAGLGGASLAPPDATFITPDLAIDWRDGNIYYQAMKLSIISSLLTALVVKGIMFGGSKVGAAFKRKPATA